MFQLCSHEKRPHHIHPFTNTTFALDAEIIPQGMQAQSRLLLLLLWMIFIVQPGNKRT